MTIMSPLNNHSNLSLSVREAKVLPRRICMLWICEKKSMFLSTGSVHHCPSICRLNPLSVAMSGLRALASPNPGAPSARISVARHSGREDHPEGGPKRYLNVHTFIRLGPRQQSINCNKHRSLHVIVCIELKAHHQC